MHKERNAAPGATMAGPLQLYAWRPSGPPLRAPTPAEVSRQARSLAALRASLLPPLGASSSSRRRDRGPLRRDARATTWFSGAPPSSFPPSVATVGGGGDSKGPPPGAAAASPTQAAPDPAHVASPLDEPPMLELFGRRMALELGTADGALAARERAV